MEAKGVHPQEVSGHDETQLRDKQHVRTSHQMPGRGFRWFLV